MDIWEVVSWGLMAMLLLRFGVVLVNWVSPLHLSPELVMGPDGPTPKVSILIPARNEAHNLPSILSDIKNLEYPHLEVVVCNDHSTDATVEVLINFAMDWPALKYFDSDPLPEGWMGKNFACYQLTKRASGDWLLFLDADVRLQRDALSKAVDYALRKRVSLLSIFPQQIMISKGERQTVPVMNWILLSMLPLVAARLGWFRSLSAANGQFMLFEAAAYHRHDWHRLVWDQNVEDMAIARIMKGQKQPIAVLLGNADVFCRMYASKEEAIQGFARNMHHFFGGHRMWMSLFVIIAWLRMPYFALVGQWWFLTISVIIVLAMKLGVAHMSRQPIKLVLFLHFTHLCNMIRMAIANIKNGKQVTWKGRVYSGSMSNEQ
ncbi:MAG: glycosyltransferase family 2 protein [Bacteroidales bacterium]|nr:glycosyltransferase family 2 protein [Bacteroidales bacterium]